MRRHGAVLRRVAANGELARALLAFLAFCCAENGVWVSVLVYAYEHGGTNTAAVIAVVQLLPAAVVAPVASMLTDRRGGAAGLWVGYVAQAVSIAATAALLLASAPPVAVYAAAVIAACAVTFSRPAHAALLPLLVSNPRELTAANVVSGWCDTGSFLLGPAAAGFLIGLQGPGLSLALFAAATALAALLVAPLAARPAAVPAPANEHETDGAGPAVLAALRAEPGAPTLLGTVAFQYIGLGAFDVLAVVLAIHVLGLGASGAGYLNSAFGAGGLIGGALAVGLIGRRRLVPPLALSGLAWGAAFLLIGAWPTAAGAFTLLACGGAARTVLDVSGRTLLQRTVPAHVRGRVFGVLESFSMLGFAIGSASIPLLALAGGAQAAVAGIGLLLAFTAASTVRILIRLEARAPSVDAELALLRESAIFGVLAAPELEELARALTRADLPAGTVVVHEGEIGDRFYLVGAGSVAVSVGGIETATLVRSDGFGEIALLRGGARTATVTAREPVTLYALERADFLDAVTGSQHAREAGERVVAERLQRDPGSTQALTHAGSGAPNPPTGTRRCGA